MIPHVFFILCTRFYHIILYVVVYAINWLNSNKNDMSPSFILFFLLLKDLNKNTGGG